MRRSGTSNSGKLPEATDGHRPMNCAVRYQWRVRVLVMVLLVQPLILSLWLSDLIGLRVCHPDFRRWSSGPPWFIIISVELQRALSKSTPLPNGVVPESRLNGEYSSPCTSPSSHSYSEHRNDTLAVDSRLRAPSLVWLVLRQVTRKSEILNVYYFMCISGSAESRRAE